MDYMNAFYDILDKTTEIALATSVDNMPSVRIISICYDKNRPGVIYFQTRHDVESKKTSDFSQNNNVAFTTAPIGLTIANVRSNDSIVVKSEYTFDELKSMFIAKVPEYEEQYNQYAHILTVYEIHIKKAIVVVDYGIKQGIVEF